MLTRIEQIKHDDHLVRFYTSFITYDLFVAFYTFLGAVVHKLNYWGSKEGSLVKKLAMKTRCRESTFHDS